LVPPADCRTELFHSGYPRIPPGRAQPVPASEIAKLDQQIKDIGALKKQRDDLLARKQLVERLQQGVMMPYTFSTSWYARPRMAST
jgi:hypothetical protein